jgi:hypothetical protein
MRRFRDRNRHRTSRPEPAEARCRS